MKHPKYEEASSPDGVLIVVRVESDEEAENGEKHDGVGGDDQATGASVDRQQSGVGAVSDCRVAAAAASRAGDPGQHDGQGEGGQDDARGEEPGELPAGVAGAAVVVVPAGNEAGDGGEKVEDDDCEGVPVAVLGQGTGQE